MTDQPMKEMKRLEVFVSPGVKGMPEKVVVEYLCSGYREPVPMIDSEVVTVSEEVGGSFQGGSMFGWHAPVAEKAHEFAAMYFLADESIVN
tara:strand:- start:251 stop:523 length:273 start_codon:yes stop_codon:yes gene_type:complete